MAGSCAAPCEPVGMCRCVLRDFVKDMRQSNLRLPWGRGDGVAGIEDEPGNVVWTVRAVGNGLMRTEAVVAPGGQLCKGHGVCLSAGDVHKAAGRASVQLIVDHAGKVAGMKGIAHLIALPAETEVL